MRPRLIIVSIALMGVAVLLAPDSQPEERSAAIVRAADTSVGRVQGTEAFIALRYDGRRLQAYAGDGSARRAATISGWFEAGWDGSGPVTMTSDDLRLRVTRMHADGRISGRLDGHRFTADPATGPAGLFDRDGRRSVVLADGSVRN
ncbi:MAG TPA: hypothetical protein VNO82_06765 [Solirubrobacteraceae bacterium]|nr:hypothetical protein [Solirubrobacteraceae bacterium]